MTELAVVCAPVYFWGGRKPFDPQGNGTIWYETVEIDEISRSVALAPAAECQGVRGYLATVLWPPGTTAGEVAAFGADKDDDNAYSLINSITYPEVNLPSPSGLVLTFMRLQITALPAPGRQLAARVLLR